MNYILEIEINTDDDFCIPYVPRGMEYDESGLYSLRKKYEDREKAIHDTLDIVNFLDRQMETSRDYVRRKWNECINDFTRQLEENVHEDEMFTHSTMSGNYDGTNFRFYSQTKKVNFALSVTDEEYKLIMENRRNIHDDIKNFILNMCKKE